MKFTSYNIQYGFGADGKNDLARIASELRGADVIALQEVERFWERSGDVDQAALLAELLPEYYWVYGANLDMDASHKDANGAVQNRRRQFGTMILSRHPIVSSRNFPLPKYGTMTQHSIQQGVLEAVLDLPSAPLRVYCTHLSHLCSETRRPQVGALMDIVNRAPLEGGAWCGGHPDPRAGWTQGEMPPMPREAILMGDMNFTHASPEYAMIVGVTCEKYGRLINPQGFADAYVLAGHEEQSGYSVISQQYRIDHCFISSSLAPKLQKAWIDVKAQGSDHYPLHVELDV
ncbi:Endonuclease/Exonuclease/phosphatase family protein [Pseudovibrio axinellae]|uniref:Endonuclease/Exonuclease/phosphatase family protein n=1 Tax=Pseudovibrio axinellae TaxID=989403 RepID=A0A165Y373_9HYPH|nr:endonuclease/exonuclease/phosphatase family protein [Pseudovibrio axinellae]KZL18391.1 Endonuclease/Exonuclease/phosphatase family protein [Pseudovibrio axinellae]SER70568.1 Metal-dependent hydrolase, endonuclease/exonuclease/phosphatase family [Pseudovibrio axinellae]